MTFTKLFIIFVTCVAAAHSVRVRGEFGKQKFPIDMEFGEDDMVVTMHKPLNAPADFRETTNLHIFPKHLVAVKNSRERQCYVRYFVESEDQMKGRVENAEYNNGMMGNVTEERFYLDGIPPLSTRNVNLILGEKIADFCRGHDVFFLGEQDYVKLDPKNPDLHGRERRSASSIIAAGTCQCCGCCCKIQ